ncbi:hypothetical protein KAJ89_03765 [Candidatus Parcubacteria bacterium]|nr:hypothetical protein [Candidatus Parcubacteria bacterium]
MNFYFIITSLSSLLTLLLGIIVLLKNPKKDLNYVFFIFSSFISIWMAGSAALLKCCYSIEVAILFDRVTYFGVIFIPPSLLHLNALFAKEVKHKKLAFISYFVSAVFFLLSFSDKFIFGLIQYSWGCHTKAGIFHHIFIVYFIVFIIFALRRLVIAHRKAIGSEKAQLKYVLIALAVLSIGGLGFLPAYGIGLPPFVYLCGIVAVIIMTYAIVRHRLMDIRFVVRQGSVLLASLLTIISSILLIKYLFFKLTAVRVGWTDYVFLIFGILAYPYINKYFYRIANKYFFTSLYDAREVIASLSDKLSSTLLVGDIYKYISQEIISALHVKAMGIFIFDQNEQLYELKYYKGNERDKIKSFIEDKGFYTNYLKTNDPVEVDEIKRTVYIKYRKTVDMLVANNVKVLIPLRLKSETIGMIALGEKETKDNYNDQDIAMLEIIGTQSAIAVNNALSYTEIKNFSKKLEHEVDVATEGLVRANSKLRQLDQAKSEFVSIASHQLRTPLTVIKGYISMMLEGSYGKLSALHRESLDKVFQSNERLIHLVENLLNISRIESGRLKINKEKIRLELMVADVSEELMIRAKSKGIKLIYKKPKKKIPSVNIDKEKIRQVILNLIDNAVKYTKKGKVEVSVEQKGNYLQCLVKDTGMGFTKADYIDLFDKFSRGVGTDLVHTEGTGLGLYVAKQMITLHKGKIWAKSKGQGKGSEFYFTLPVLNKINMINKKNKKA